MTRPITASTELKLHERLTGCSIKATFRPSWKRRRTSAIFSFVKNTTNHSVPQVAHFSRTRVHGGTVRDELNPEVQVERLVRTCGIRRRPTLSADKDLDWDVASLSG